MKALYRTGLILSASAALLSLGGCGYTDEWDPQPPTGWNSNYYDARLVGDWQLYQANSQYVSGDAVNYLDFYGRGVGRYYYYHNGYRDSDRMAYWCQQSVSGTSYNQVNIQYEGSAPSTMNYWFSDGGTTLWLQWRNGNGVQTYVYHAVDGTPW